MVQTATVTATVTFSKEFNTEDIHLAVDLGPTTHH